jgi:hypothetical protein
MEVSGQLHAPVALPPRKSTLYPLNRRLGWPQSRSGRRGEEKSSQPLPGLEPLINQQVKYMNSCMTKPMYLEVSKVYLPFSLMISFCLTLLDGI